MNGLSNWLRVLLAVCVSCAGGSLLWGQDGAEAVPGGGAAVLRTAQAVRRLPPAEAVLKRPVDVTGVVTLIEPGRTIFLEDETGGTFCKVNKLVPRTLEAGDRIRLTGMTYSGLYLPGIDPTSVDVVGEGPLPPGKPVTFADLAGGELNYQRVQLSGIVRTVRSGGDRTLLLLASGAEKVEVHLPTEAQAAAEALIDARITVRGLAAGYINDRRQLVTPHVRCLGMEEVLVQEPPRPVETLPVTPARELLRFPVAGAAGHRAKVRGAVTHATGERLFLRDEEVGLMVEARGAQAVAPGTIVEVAGFPVMGRFIAFLEDAVWITVAEGEPPVPTAIDLKKVLTGAHDADLISVEAELRELVRSAQEVTLLLRSGPVLFPARLALADVEAEVPGWRVGSQLRLNGVCAVAETTTRPTSFSSTPVSFELLLRSPGDVLVLRKAPWWTARKLAAIALACLAAAALALGWAAVLRGQVTRQTRVIASKLHTEAVSEERQRIAREFHDTLEQELVALSLRLDTASAKISEGPVRTLLEGARRLVDRLQSEGRDFIWNLREHVMGPEELRAAILEATGTLCTDAGTMRVVEVTGEPRVMRGAPAHSLVRIAQEATANAVRHGQATQVEITIDFREQEVALTVRDNGRGFEVTDPPRAAPGHFGLQGMRERMQKANGQLKIESTPGQGSRVQAVVPLLA